MFFPKYKKKSLDPQDFFISFALQSCIMGSHLPVFRMRWRLLLTFLTPFRFLISTSSWLLQPRLALIIKFPTTSSLLLNSRSNCASPFIDQSITFIKNLPFTPSRSLLSWLHRAMLPFQQMLGKLKFCSVNKVCVMETSSSCLEKVLLTSSPWLGGKTKCNKML